MLAFVVVAMTVAGASEVSLTVEPATACVERGRLVSALQAKGLRVRETPGAETLLVRVTSSGGAVEVRGTQRERKLERRVPVEGAACPAVERVVVALIESWANMKRPAVERDAGTIQRLDGGASRGDSFGAENVRVDARTASSDVVAEQRADGGVRSSTQGVSARKEDAGVPAIAVARADDGTVSSVRRENAGVPATAVLRADAGTPGIAGAQSLTSIAVLRGGDGTTAAAASSGLREDAGARASTLETALSPAGEREDAGVRASTPSTALAPAGEREDAGAQASTLETALSPTLSPAGEREDAGARASTLETARSPAGEKELARAQSERSPLRLDVAVLGGATIDASGLPAGTGSLLVRGAIGRWGLVVDAALESARSNTIAPVTVSASQQTLSASFSVAFEPASSLTLDVALGLRGWRVEGAATGADEAFAQSTLRWGGVLSAGLAWRLTGPLFLTARGSASVRDRVIHFNVPPLAPVLSLNPWNFGLQGGVLVRFD
jgi:hypothetical protein